MAIRGRLLVITLATVLSVLAATATAAARVAADDPTRPLALVYRGPASVPGTAESVATVLRDSPSRFRVEYVGPGDTPITPETLSRAVVFAQPGGPSLRTAWQAMRPYADTIRSWIAAGGNYLGFCVGGYLAGATPGYNLLPGDTSQYSAKPGASVTNTRAARSTVTWRGQPYDLYFQDPPAFELNPGHGATILATYRGGEVAALTTNYGRGRVGVVGPHVEADRSWFVDDGLPADGAVHPELAYDLIETTIAGNRNPVPLPSVPLPPVPLPSS